ncbi:MAG: 1,6-anhydro-N-acetylmuramyl-L-alanine amidase AmpD [Pseudomonadota bacterium]
MLTDEMDIDLNHHLTTARWMASDHCDARPPGITPELIVLHCVSLPEGTFGTGAPERLFCGVLDVAEHPSFADLRDLRVAPHVLIDRQGRLLQFVGFDQRAWHAGVSSWRGRTGCNDYSIGIELEGDIHQPFTGAQYASLAGVLGALLQRYPQLSVGAIVGHNEIAPGRKQDPGPFFDWHGLLERLHRVEFAANLSPG